MRSLQCDYELWHALSSLQYCLQVQLVMQLRRKRCFCCCNSACQPSTSPQGCLHKRPRKQQLLLKTSSRGLSLWHGRDLPAQRTPGAFTATGCGRIPLMRQQLAQLSRRLKATSPLSG